MCLTKCIFKKLNIIHINIQNAPINDKEYKKGLLTPVSLIIFMFLELCSNGKGQQMKRHALVVPCKDNPLGMGFESVFLIVHIE